MNGNVNLSPNLVIIEFFSRFSPGFLGLVILFLFFIQILLIFGVPWEKILSGLKALEGYGNLILIAMFFLAYFVGTIIKEISYIFCHDTGFPYLEAVKETFKETFPEQKYKEIISFYEKNFPEWGQSKRVPFSTIKNRPYNDFYINKDLYYLDYCKNELKILSPPRAELQLMGEAIIRFFLALQAWFSMIEILAFIILIVSFFSFCLCFLNIIHKNIIFLIGIIIIFLFNIIILFISKWLVVLIYKPIRRKRFWESINLWINYYEFKNNETYTNLDLREDKHVKI